MQAHKLRGGGQHAYLLGLGLLAPVSVCRVGGARRHVELILSTDGNDSWVCGVSQLLTCQLHFLRGVMRSWRDAHPIKIA